MNTYFLKICYALVLLLLHAAGSIDGSNRASRSGDVKCIEKERQALLNFKQSLIDDSGMLSTWRNDGDCCEWKGIECNNETDHVQLLRLRGLERHYLSGEINITSLIELQNMEHLDLSSNNFYDNQIPKHMDIFINLRYLNLSYMNSGGRIPYELGNLSQLEYLDLSGYYLVGAIPSQLGKLTHLRHLDLSGNYQIDGEIPYQLGNLSQLQCLGLGGTSLLGVIPFHVGNLPMLQTLKLSGISGLSINDGEWLSNLTSLTNLDLSSFSSASSHHWLQSVSRVISNLKELRLSDCVLSDNDIVSLFESHSNFSTSLTILDLSYNKLTSSTFQLLSNFSFHHLQELYLSDNGIVMSFPPYLNFPSLVILDLSSNNLTSSIFQGNSNFGTKLEELYLQNCSLSDNSFLTLSPTIMNSSSSLVILDLSFNMLTSSTLQLLSNFSCFHLQELYLSHNNIVMLIPPYLNFPSLVILDLSFNNLTSSIFQGNSNFGTKLEELNLQNCSLSDNSFLALSPSIVNSSSSLVILDLSDNLLTSSAIFHWLSNFTTNLHTLYLYSNLLEGPIPNDFGKEMNSLEILYLSYNKLQGELPAFLGNICTLRKLYLSGNNLSGEMSSFIQNTSWCNRHIFQSLDLSNNRITGLLPKSIGLLYDLEVLYLGGNSLEGDITGLHFANLSNLKRLDFSDNSLSLKFGTTWVPPFQLSHLGLASCMLGPSFPSWLQTQRHLDFLDISDAGINDSVPVWFWNKLQSIRAMNISHNNLIGTIPKLQLKLADSDYMLIVLNSNQFEGSVPSFLLQATTLDLSKNKISDLNSFLCGKSTMSNMRTLDLSDNEIEGRLSDCWGHLNSLEFLDLSNNKLSGKIPPSMTTLVNLKFLVLRNNSFIGEMPSTLKNCTNLLILDVGDNLLSGSIPSWIGESLQQLRILSLRVNHFFGTLPLYLCYLRRIHLLDLSRNNLLGKIPTCLKNFTTMLENSIVSREFVREILLPHHMWYFDSYKSNALLMWKGHECLFRIKDEFLLKSIDLSSNHLSGEMPVEFGQLLGLISLNLSRNNLSGEIPSKIGNLKSLEFLDLSINHFSGRIPSTLSQIDRLTRLNLSKNSLSGKIPLGTQLQSFDPSSFEGNLDLCGKPLDKSCPEDETPLKPQGPATDDKDDNSIFYEALYMSMGIGFFTGFWSLMEPLLLWRSWRNAYMRFLNRLIDYAYVMFLVNVARCRRWLNG